MHSTCGNTQRVFFKTQGVFIKTHGVFFKSHGVFSKTRKRYLNCPESLSTKAFPTGTSISDTYLTGTSEVPLRYLLGTYPQQRYLTTSPLSKGFSDESGTFDPISIFFSLQQTRIFPTPPYSNFGTKKRVQSLDGAEPVSLTILFSQIMLLLETFTNPDSDGGSGSSPSLPEEWGTVHVYPP